jgi:hypothetical protein
MNILEQENIIKGAPDEVLLQEAQAPSGQLPQFLVVSEIQRRKEMRNRFAAQETQPEQTVSEQIVAEASAPQGIAGLASEMPSQAPSMPMPQQTIPQEMMVATEAPIDPQMLMAAGGGMMPYPAMADGGIVEMQEGRQVPRSEGLQRAIMEVLTGKYTPEDKLINELVRRSGIPVLRDVHSRRGTLHLSRPGIFGKNSEMALRYNPRHKSGGVQFIKRFQEGGSTTQGDEIDPNNGADGISTSDILNSTDQQIAEQNSELSSQQGATDENAKTPLEGILDERRRVQEESFARLQDYMQETLQRDEERQRKSMMSDALVNIGAGIASGNIGAGLEKAGASVAATRKAQRDRRHALELQMLKERPGVAGASGSRVQSTQTLANGNIALVLVDGTLVDTGQKSLRTAGRSIRIIEGVPHIVDAVTQKWVPLSTQAKEIDFEIRKSRAEYEEQQRQERLTQAPRVANALYEAVNTTGTVDEAVENAMKFLESNTTAGAVGSTLSWIPGTDMFALGLTLDTLKANLGFDRLQRMREASPTGGALGQVSDNEIRFLVRAAGAIEQGLPPDILRERLGYLLEEYKGFRDSAISDFISHADAVENEDVQKDYERRIDLIRRKAENLAASPGSRRSSQAVVDAWDAFQRRYGDISESNENGDGNGQFSNEIEEVLEDLE